MSAPLKLIALDADDLAVISTHVQDARVQAGDIIWRQADKRLVVGMSRLDWEQTLAGEAEPRRRLAALRFDRVLACKSRRIDLSAPDQVLDLVGVEFHPQGSQDGQNEGQDEDQREAQGEAQGEGRDSGPGGSTLLLFAGGAAIRLDVECLECELTDLGSDELGTGLETEGEV